MSNWKRIAIFCVVCIGYSKSFQITSETTLDNLLFPVQSPNPDNPRSFFRRTGNDLEEIFCPNGYEFESHQMKCVMNEKPSISNDLVEFNQQLCNNAPDGDYPNPEKCGTFLTCSNGISFVRDCGGILSYNAETGECGWPLEAGCCEYKEKNPGRLVQ